MSNTIKLEVRVPHLQKEYDVDVPETTTAQRLYDALMARVEPSSNGQGLEGPVVYELTAKRAQKKIYPDYKDQSLQQIGIKTGETIIIKKDMDPGSI